MQQFPVEQPDAALLAFEFMPERQLTGLDRSIPLPFSLVALWHESRFLMVFNRFRHAWELPGGMLDPGETPRAAAFRELKEESGQEPADLDFAGVATLRLDPDGRLEYGAIYVGSTDSPSPFVENEEMSAAMWWSPQEDLPDLLPIDAALARCVAPR